MDDERLTVSKEMEIRKGGAKSSAFFQRKRSTGEAHSGWVSCDFRRRIYSLNSCLTKI